jgi:hypothetical protein
LSYREYYQELRAIIRSFAISDVQLQVDLAQIAREMENCRAMAWFSSGIFVERAGPQRADANVANEGALICLAVRIAVRPTADDRHQLF